MRYLILIVLALVACGPARVDRPSPSSREVGAAELALSTEPDVLTHLEHSRPGFRMKFRTAAVYVDGRLVGGVEALRLPTQHVSVVRLYTSAEAPLAFRSDGRPVVEVVLRR